jgi:hypothetical protein
MSIETVAWIRANAWRQTHRTTHAETPVMYAACACKLGPCGCC